MGSRIAQACTVAAAALAVVPVADAADKVRVSVVKGYPVEMAAAGAAENEYDVNSGSDPTAFCRGGVPLTVGWSGATAPISGTDLRLGDNPYFSLDARRPKAAGTLRGVAVCATGKSLRPQVKVATAGTAVSCGSKLTLGFAASESWPYIETPVSVGPTGSNGWTADAGERPRPSAICVARSAFKRVATVRATGSFAAGSATATVSASCTGGRRALAWGYEASPIAGNTWKSEDTSSKRSTPFVGDALPTAGAKGFKVTFRTADNLPATAASPVAVSVRCGAPAA
jgi:hypothetical protein